MGRGQWSGHGRARRADNKLNLETQPESGREAKQHIDARQCLAALDASDRGLPGAEELGELGLAEAAGLTDLADLTRELEFVVLLVHKRSELGVSLLAVSKVVHHVGADVMDFWSVMSVTWRQTCGS